MKLLARTVHAGRSLREARRAVSEGQRAVVLGRELAVLNDRILEHAASLVARNEILEQHLRAADRIAVALSASEIDLDAVVAAVLDYRALRGEHTA